VTGTTRLAFECLSVAWRREGPYHLPDENDSAWELLEVCGLGARLNPAIRRTGAAEGLSGDRLAERWDRRSADRLIRHAISLSN
jgi:hypothetical protein